MAFYLIDYENTNEAGFNGLKNLKKEDTVVLFYSNSKSSKKISIEIVHNIMKICKLECVKAECGTPNALDFQLSSYLGFLIKEKADNGSYYSNKETFYIVSKDKGYQPLVSFWKQQQKVEVKTVINLTGKTVDEAEKEKKEAEQIAKIEAEKEAKLKKERIKTAVKGIVKEEKVEEVVKIFTSCSKESKMKKKLTTYLGNEVEATKLIMAVKAKLLFLS